MSKVFIIAEAGVNHNGEWEIARKLVDVAVKAGADAVKFQTFKAERLVCKNAEKANYQKATTDQAESHFDMLKKLEMSEEMHNELIDYCRERGILFLSTPFDIGSVEYLTGLGIDIIKIPSGEITNYPYLRKIAQTAKRVILSTGMSNLEEVRDAVEVLRGYVNKEIAVLHCNTEYPTPFTDVNLKAMLTIQDELGVTVGYSDHTPGIEIPIAAVAMGAQIIEKHFTLDRTMDGPDHKASLEPQELRAMVRAIRNVEMALGNGVKVPSKSEEMNIGVVRKSIVAKREIKRGEVFTEDNLVTKRPGTGISPMKWNELIGTIANKDYKEDELIEL